MARSGQKHDKNHNKLLIFLQNKTRSYLIMSCIPDIWYFEINLILILHFVLSTMIVTKILEVIPRKSFADMLSLPLLLTTFGGVTDWYSEPRL